MNEKRVLYTVQEAAEMLSISQSQLQAIHREKLIAFTRVGARGTRVHIDEIRSFASSLETF